MINIFNPEYDTELHRSVQLNYPTESDTDNEQFRIHSALQQPFEYPTDSSTESESETANYTK